MFDLTKCITCRWNGLHVDEILIKKKFNLLEPKKKTYVLSNYEFIIIVYQIFSMM
jgi:hypothetical protein